jgi:hypothetical protein
MNYSENVGVEVGTKGKKHEQGENKTNDYCT